MQKMIFSADRAHTRSAIMGLMLISLKIQHISINHDDIQFKFRGDVAEEQAVFSSSRVLSKRNTSRPHKCEGRLADDY